MSDINLYMHMHTLKTTHVHAYRYTNMRTSYYTYTHKHTHAHTQAHTYAHTGTHKQSQRMENEYFYNICKCISF